MSGGCGDGTRPGGGASDCSSCSGTGLADGADLGGGEAVRTFVSTGCCLFGTCKAFAILCFGGSASFADLLVGDGVNRTGAPGMQWVDLAVEALVPRSDTTLRNGRSDFAGAGASGGGSVCLEGTITSGCLGVGPASSI